MSSVPRIFGLLVAALLLCLPRLASGQILSVSCSPATGPTTAGVQYSATCTASGGIAPYSWSISSGALPNGLTLTPSGDTTAATIAGSATTSGSYSYTVQVTDSTPVIPMTATQSYSGTVAPNITSISPPSATAGQTGFILTVNGAGFGFDSVVYFNGSPLTTTVVNDSEVTAPVPASIIATPAAVPVTLTSGGASSNSANFTVAPPPMISSISPTSATAGASAFTLTVNGSGFGPDAIVNFNGTAVAPSSITTSQVIATVPASVIASTGTVPVTVTSGGVTSNSANFTVLAAPVITTISPTTATAGGPAFTLTVNGSNFGGSSTIVKFNGAALTTSVVSSSQVTASVPASSITSAGTIQVTVTSGGVTSNSANFTVLAAPVITTISPTSATAGGPAFTLTVNGSSFASGAAVQWNGSPLSTTFVSATQLTAVVPANLIAGAGTASVTVTSGSVNSNGLNFAVVLGPTISLLSPSTTFAGGPAFTLVVSGTGFNSGAAVQWNGSPLSTTFVSATQLTAAVPANLIVGAGTASLIVTSGGVNSNPLSFAVVLNPTISSLSPVSATAGGPAFALTLNGAGFASGAVVEWNSTPLSTTFNSATQLVAAVPASLIASPGTASVTVQSGGVTTNGVSFAVIAGPVLTNLSPDAITAGSGAGLSAATSCPANVAPVGTLVVNGSGFAQGATVKWNAQSLSTAFVNSSQVTACVPSSLVQAYGTAQVTVASGGVTSNALPISLGVPVITLTGLESTSEPTQQVQLGIQLASVTPADLTGTLQLTFATAASGVPSGYMDPALQFSAGGTTLNFTVPAGSSSVSALSGGTIQQGTVDGTITVTLTSLTSGATNLLPSTPVTGSITIPALAPVITTGSAQITNVTSSTFDVVLTGYSTTRDMTSANFIFTAAPGTQFTGSTTFSVPVSSVFNMWFSSQAGQNNGSTFLLTFPFTISGDVNVLQSVTVTLANSAGTSVSATASR